MREEDIDKVTARYKTTCEVTLSGDVSSFDDAVRTSMKIGFAGTVGVSADQVDLTIVSASVQARFETFSSSRAAMNAIEAAVLDKLGSRDEVAAMLASADVQGVTVESKPKISTAADEGADNTVLIVCASAGGALAFVLLLALVMLTRRRAAERTTRPVKMEHVYNDRREAATKPTALAVDPVQPPAYYSDSAKSMNDVI